MKKQILLLAALIYIHEARAQSLYSMTDVQVRTDGYLASEYCSYTFTERIGAFLYLSQEKGYVNIAPGVLLTCNTTASTKSYWEVGMGIGSTLSKKELEEPTYWYAHMYAWYETKPDEHLAKGKFSFQCIPAYTFNTSDAWWLQSFAVYSLTKRIDIGAHFQSLSAKGVRLNYNVPLRKECYVRLYGVAGWGTLIGATLIVQK